MSLERQRLYPSTMTSREGIKSLPEKVGCGLTTVVAIIVLALVIATYILPSEYPEQWTICSLYGQFCLLSMSTVCIIAYLFSIREKEKTSLTSTFLFELCILSFFLICIVSNATVVVGIEADQRHNSTVHVYTLRQMIHGTRAICAALFLLWFTLYNMVPPAFSSPSPWKTFFQSIIYGISYGITLAEIVRLPISIRFYPDLFRIVFEKTGGDVLYFSITLPATSMFWLKCFFKLYQSKFGCNLSKT